jgi:hypothetical protein
MPRQKVPDIDFEFFTLQELEQLFKENRIYINTTYQRGDIWKERQRIELIQSIESRYSIGVLVLFMNEKDQYEILDGQQRLLTIEKYLTDKLDLTKTDLQKYSELNVREKSLINAYCVYYLKLKSHDSENKEEDIVQTFLRLQEGTPLNKAEKINAHRGKFKETFRELRETHPLFEKLGKEKRFRFRQLAAELLLLELESDLDKKVFPGLDLKNMIHHIKKYKNEISKKKVTFVKGNLDFLNDSLNILLTAFTPRDVISFYLLVSYLRQKKAGNENLKNELAEFAQEFLKNLHSFTIFDDAPPEGMSKDIFIKYKSYKQESKIPNKSDSIEKRFEIIVEEYERLKPFIKKDPKRLHDIEQKRKIYFRQKGLCAFCGKELNFLVSSAHHGIAHSKGGRTDDTDNTFLLHARCHARFEKLKEKNDQIKLNFV